jgi:hypothetical protein
MTTRKFDSIRRTREQIDHLILGFSVALAGVVTGIVAVCVRTIA